ncbi:hypothetical protein DL98DRAFT_527767 [Cadophora sp. DSE1049]|nr:hypothetical protein DL98DRAFT_527767 [Cadophora sp. DSE1049]
MPRYAIDLNLGRSNQAIASSLRILSAMFVVYLFGFLSDAGYHRKLMASSAIATSLVHLAWGFVKDGYQLYAYAIAVGLTSGGYDICLFGIFSEIAANDDEYYMSLYSMFSFFRGMATVTVGTVGVKLLRLSPEVLGDSYALGKYQR